MVMPITEATANNAILESMACGLPLVVSDVGAVRDYVCPTSTALTPPSDARAMADRVIDLLENEAERGRMACEARNHVLAFAWPNIVRQLAAVYEAVA